MQSFTTRAGIHVTIRPLHPTEGAQLLDLGEHLSPDTRYQRFHVALDHLQDAQMQRILAQLLDVDQVNRIALVAVVTDETGHDDFVAVARAHRIANSDEAESAVVVRDDYQNQGLGLYMLECLVEATRRAGFKRLRGYIQPSNMHMFHLLHKLNLHYETQVGHGEASVVIFLQPEPQPT